MEVITAVQYGMDLPEPLASKAADTLARASPQMSAVLYGLLETFWREHTHRTMMVLAALCVPLDVANEYFP